jgi:hypothetical protein
MVLNLVIIGLAITLEPITLVAFVVLLSVERGLRNGFAFITGWTLTLIAVVAGVVGVTGAKPPRPHTAPSTTALVVKALLGAALIWYGLWRRRRPIRPRTQPKWMGRLSTMSLWAVGGLGVFLQPWTLVAAGAATVVQAKLSHAGDWLALIVFCLLATSSFLAMELYAAFRPQAAAIRFDKLQVWINGHIDQAIVVGALLLGLYLLADSIYLIVA